MGVSWREGSDEGFGKSRVSNSTGDIDHVVDVEDDKTIVGKREGSDYGSVFSVLKG